MYNKKQINAIIKMLKDRSIDGRPALQQVFEQGGYLWATNGYVALELGEVKDELKGKCVTLASLVGWSGTHKANETTTLVELVENNEHSEPDMVSLLHKDYAKSDDPMFNVEYMKIATDFLGVSQIALEQADNNGSVCYRVKPLESMHVANEAMGIKVKENNMRGVTVITDKQGIDHYIYDGQDFTLIEGGDKKRYACLTDALKDSEPWRNEHYSDGECLDYVIDILEQLEGANQI